MACHFISNLKKIVVSLNICSDFHPFRPFLAFPWLFFLCFFVVLQEKRRWKCNMPPGCETNSVPMLHFLVNLFFSHS